jgi:hypothetical protein
MAANGTGATFLPKVGLDKHFRSTSRWHYMLSLDAAVTIHASFSLVNKAALQKENRTSQWRQMAPERPLCQKLALISSFAALLGGSTSFP